MSGAAVVALLVRYGMVLLFLPFSALDKVLGFGNAVKQAQEVFGLRLLAIAVLLVGLAIEVFCTLGVVTGVADRACAFVIAAGRRQRRPLNHIQPGRASIACKHVEGR